MFKEKFNTLSVAIEEFSIKWKTIPQFLKPADKILYYRSLVDDYYMFNMHLDSILADLNLVENKNLDTIQILIDEIHTTKDEIENIFNNYKDDYIVKTYIKELNSVNDKNNLFEKIFKFEKMLIETPIIKIEDEIIDDILSYVKRYATTSNQFYFFATNPFIIDEDFGLSIPQKKEYMNADTLIHGVYNYIFEIYNHYKLVNVSELEQMKVLELTLRERVYNFSESLKDTKKKRIITETITPSEFVDVVENIKNKFDIIISTIINDGVYRFYSLSKTFNETHEQYNRYINELYDVNLYKDYINEQKYYEKLDKLQEFIYLIEDGKINKNKDYILTDGNLKSVVEDLIILVRQNKKSIYYTQKFNDSGFEKIMKYEFYQTEQFLYEIKKYYYGMMTKNVFKHTTLTIDEFGDDTISEYRTNYKTILGKYNTFISQEKDFMNEFEVEEYIKDLEIIQTKVKSIAINFFNAALKTSPLTFTEIIEQTHKKLLDGLKSDLENVKNNDILDLIKINTDENREKALEKIRDIFKHISDLEETIKLSEQYIFIDMTDFIRTNIYIPYNNFYTQLKELFNANEYLNVIETYEKFYKMKIFDFNMLFSLEKLAGSTKKIFNNIDLLNKIYISEQISNVVVDDELSEIKFVIDMFDDETYKVIRNELFGQLDIYYEFVIEVRKNEKQFLINEKNLKKVYFDNQLIKINYIRLYHSILKEKQKLETIKEEARKYEWFNEQMSYILSFDYKERIESQILNQNRILSNLTKTIIENSVDNNYDIIDVSMYMMDDLEEYNKSIKNEILKYSENITRIIESVKYEKLNSRFNDKLNTHKDGWKTLIFDNKIPEPEKISYNEMEIFKGSIPYFVNLEAKTEIKINDGGEIERPSFVWDFGNGIVKEGNKIKHTFYEVGQYKIKCEMKYTSGETSTRFIEFDISGPTNSQSIKSHKFEYSPNTLYNKQSLITYYDTELNKQMTIPINVTLGEDEKTIVDAIGKGTISVSKSDSELISQRAGLVILGFDGIEFAGEPYNNSNIFSEEFEFPETAEFLFDFKVTDPIVNKSVIDVSDSKFIKTISKVPRDLYQTPYEINDASQFQKFETETIPVMVGDMLVMKNFSDRYAIIKILDIKELLEPENNKFYFNIIFDVYVNISLNKYDRHIFKPLETNFSVPTLVFKTNTRELFTSLIDRLEQIDLLKKQLIENDDNASTITINKKIEMLENENRNFYLFEEYSKLKAKINGLEQYKTYLYKQCFVNLDSCSIDELITANISLEKKVNETKNIKEYMYDIHVYEFKKNIVDIEILYELYTDQLIAMDIIIDTYNFRKYNTCDHFKDKLKTLKFFPTTCMIDLENSELVYEKKLALLVKKVRDFIFKIKLIVNFPILSEGVYINFSQPYTRPFKNEETGLYEEKSDYDFYLLNKKIEMTYGYETEKVELGSLYVDFVQEIIHKQRSLFGTGMSNIEVENLGNYIQMVEEQTVSEYDDFFMIPFWIDYLNKAI